MFNIFMKLDKKVVSLIFGIALATSYALSCFSEDLYMANIGSSNFSEDISNIENQVYSRNYDKDTIERRVNRLERTIYGSKSNGTFRKRIDILKNTLISRKAQNSDAKQRVILDLLENRYFGASYKGAPGKERLARLEKTILGKSMTGDFDLRFHNLMESVPMSVIGISVGDSSGRRITVKPEIKEVFTPVSNRVFNKLKESYFSNIAIYQNNSKVLRWKDTPVYVYVSPDLNFDNLKYIKNSVRIWNKHFPLYFINNSAKAQIIINADNVKSNLTRSVLAFYENEIFSQVVISCGEFIHKPYFQKFITHELGHAIGIWGHSDNPEDIMFNFKETNSDILNPKAQKSEISIDSAPEIPSDRDINTLNKIYKMPSI